MPSNHWPLLCGGAAQHLHPDGVLMAYGPFLDGPVGMAAGHRAFHHCLNYREIPPWACAN